MSKWTHVICGRCYDDLYPGREPFTINDRTVELCCWCQAPTGEGIYVRHDPGLVACGGTHKPDSQ